MFSRRITFALRMASLFVCLAFIAQVIVSEAEHFGLYTCNVFQGQVSAKKAAAEALPNCHVACCSHSPVTAESSSHLVLRAHAARSVFSTLNEFAPDGPVLAIDHPPQLS